MRNIININNSSLTIEVTLFKKIFFYYVKKRTSNLWYENKIPFFRFHLFILK